MKAWQAILGFVRDIDCSLRHTMHAFRRCSAGGVAAIFTITSPVLIGAMGLGGEAGYWYLTQRKVQNAADVAAHAAALRLNEGDDSASLQALSEFVVGNADLDMSITAVALASPPNSGAFIEDGAAVEITVTQTVPRLFTKMYSSDPIQISARAVATAQSGGTACMLALDTAGGGQGVDIADNAVVTAMLCDSVSNETGDAAVELHVDSNVTAACVRTSGDAITDGTLNISCGDVLERSAGMTDPFVGVAEPSKVGACQDKTLENTMVFPIESHPSGMNSMRFCDGIEIKGAVTLGPGLYIVENGDFTIEGGAFAMGAGVVFYLDEDVQTTFAQDAFFNLTPPTSGTYQGMMIFGSRDADGRKHTFGGMAGSMLDGAIYAPTSRLEFDGNMSTSFVGCGQYIGDDIEVKNTAVLTVHCLFPNGPIASVAGAVQIVE